MEINAYLQETEGGNMNCQCHKCHQVFKYSELSKDVHLRHQSPCCKSSYTVLSAELDAFFSKNMDVNNDPRYYDYEF